jgi:hypothetical protein
MASKRWEQEHKEERSRWQAGWRAKNWLSVSWTRYKSNCKRTGVVLGISREEHDAIVQSPCHYCGAGAPNGIDRIRPDCGYLPDNVVPCCWICNRMKHLFGLELFLDHVAKIYTHTNSKKKEGVLCQ